MNKLHKYWFISFFLVVTVIVIIIHRNGGSKNSFINKTDMNFLSDPITFKDYNSSNETFTISKRTTIISIYFPMKSKHSKTQYEKWIENFLKSVSSPLAIFTDTTSKDFILSITPEIKDFTIFYIYDDVWDILKELESERNINYREKYINEQFDKDPEKNIHSPNLYAVWNIKPHITDKIATKNPFNSSFFLYTDIGAFRDGIIPDWPNDNFIELLGFKLHKKILFGQVADFKYDPNDLLDSFKTRNLIQGGFFFGTQERIRIYKIKFYNLHDELLDKNMFVGKDQIIMNLYSFKTNSKDVVRLRTWNLKCSHSINVWFFYQKFLALDGFYNCSENKFSLLINL